MRINLFQPYFTDRDGGVVSGGGGVYSWIEEQRARLEDELSLDVFKKGRFTSKQV